MAQREQLCRQLTEGLPGRRMGARLFMEMSAQFQNFSGAAAESR